LSHGFALGHLSLLLQIKKNKKVTITMLHYAWGKCIVLKASFKALAEIGERVSGTGERWSEIKK
jgi:hypothetical protein